MYGIRQILVAIPPSKMMLLFSIITVYFTVVRLAYFDDKRSTIGIKYATLDDGACASFISIYICRVRITLPCIFFFSHNPPGFLSPYNVASVGLI